MKKDFIVGDNIIYLTSSFGIHTVCDEDKCLTVSGVIEIADRNLYREASFKINLYIDENLIPLRVFSFV